ncbi:MULTISPECIES: hypothetical protein [unclassified Microcoleus]|uniref:hypothetical protein n=1 Tax=unclassified Microcoleus TaxID=2642155 RepID=UPI002FD39EEC
MSSPVVGAELSYFFFKHKAIVLGSGAIGVCFAVILPSALSIELADADNGST